MSFCAQPTGVTVQCLSLQQQVAEASVLQTQFEAAQLEAAQHQSRAQDMYSQLDAMSRHHEQVLISFCSIYIYC